MDAYIYYKEAQTDSSKITQSDLNIRQVGAELKTGI